MNRRTIKEVSDTTGIARFTLSQAARQGRLGGAAKQEGRNWIVDVEHADYKAWLTAHAYQPRVRGKKPCLDA
jgi:hypothetical protein